VTATTLSIVVVFIPIAFSAASPGNGSSRSADHRLLGAGVAVRVVLARSDAVRVLARSAQADRTAAADLAHARRFNDWFDRQAEGYKSVIAWALDHRLAMIGLAIATFVGAVALPVMGLVGADSCRRPTNRSSRCRSRRRQDRTSPTRERRRRTGAHRPMQPEVRYTYISGRRSGRGGDEGTVFVKLTSKKERSRSQAMVVTDVRREASQLAGVTASISTGFNEGQKQIQLQLQGRDATLLAKLADGVVAEVRQVPGAVDVGLSTKGQKPELDVQLDRGLAGSIGVTVGQVAQALRPAFAGIDVGDWIDPSGETRDVTVRLAPESRTVVPTSSRCRCWSPVRRRSR
jgi:HAE1 family hydrophobic/amphiphilic exporter-1